MLRTLLFVLLIWQMSLQSVAASPDAQEIIRRTDKIRNPDQAFATKVQITEYHNAKLQDTMIVKIRSKQARGNGQFRTLVSFEKPSRDRGKLMLRNGNEVWFFDPNGKSSIRISPQQRLLGQASNGDIMTANFALDYNAELLAEETVLDADRKPHDTWHLRMTAKQDVEGLTYSNIEYWVDSKSYHPVMGRFYAESGRLLKQAYYRSFQQHLGATRPTEVIIIDGVDTSKVTRLSFSHYEFIKIPEEWLQRGFLPHFRGE